MFKGLEHPSGFPSMLRGTTPEPRQLSRKDSYGSTHQLRRDSNGYSSTPTPTPLSRKDSSGSTSLGRRDSYGSAYVPRRDSNASVLTRKDSSDFKANKRDSLNDDFRRLSFGSSIYLRPDSTGGTNLVRRDSYGRKDLTKSQRIPRDYVSKVLEYKQINVNNNNNSPDTNSILRKTSTDHDAQTNKENIANSDLTAANLSKHVTIWEKEKEKDGDEDKTNLKQILDGRRDSSGSLGNYLDSRRISIDSLDVRRNSRRGSAASCDIHGVLPDEEAVKTEVIIQFTHQQPVFLSFANFI